MGTLLYTGHHSAGMSALRMAKPYGTAIRVSVHTYSQFCSRGINTKSS